MSIKAKDIARILGVSPATVSMVLNNKPGISEARRRQIIGKINELNGGYMLKKNIIATKNIGFVVYKRQGDIINESPFFSLIIEGLSQQAKKHGYTLVLIYINKEMSYDEQLRQILDNHCVGLVIFATEMFEDDLLSFKEINLPIVIVDNYFTDSNYDTVCINNKQGIFKAVNFLAECGHKKIGFIQSKVMINSFEERFLLYRFALNELGLEFDPNYVYDLSYSNDGSYLDMKNILINDKPSLPTAVVAANDLLAFGAMRAFKESGYSIPQDLSIIGFDDRPICLYADPPLSTIAVSKDIFGLCAIDMLINRLVYKREICFTISIGVELIERGSIRRIN